MRGSFACVNGMTYIIDDSSFGSKLALYFSPLVDLLAFIYLFSYFRENWVISRISTRGGGC